MNVGKELVEDLLEVRLLEARIDERRIESVEEFVWEHLAGCLEGRLV